MEHCDSINPHQVRDLIADAIKQGTRKVGVFRNHNIADIGPALTTRPAKGIPIIYAPGPGATPTMTPDASDIRRLVKENRPYVCRAMRIADTNNCRCYSLAGHAGSLKKDMERIEESEADFKKFFPVLPEPKISMSAAEYEARYERKAPEGAKIMTVYQHSTARDYREVMSLHKRAVNEVMGDFPETFVDHCTVKL